MSKAKTLILDIETAPNIAYVWGFFKQFVAPNQVLSNSYMLSYAAKWLDDEAIIYDDAQHKEEKPLLKGLVDLLDEADVVVAHNGKKFDLPRIKGRTLVHGIQPYSPIKLVDTCVVAKKHFGFESNSQEHLANLLGIAPKQKHKKFPGFELWLECLRKNPDAWEELKKYNISDVVTLQQMYLKMRPFMDQHPNVALLGDAKENACPKCGSEHVQRRGFYHTNTQKYQRFQCQGCGGWHRTRFTEVPKEDRRKAAVNAV